MSGYRAQPACIALMLAAMVPLLAGCDQPTSATPVAAANEPDVSIVVVHPRARSMVRELPASLSNACSTRAAR